MSEKIKTPLEPQLYTAKIRESDKLVTGFLVDHKSWPRSVIIEVFDIKDKRHPMTLHYVDRNSVRKEMSKETDFDEKTIVGCLLWPDCILVFMLIGGLAVMLVALIAWIIQL